MCPLAMNIITSCDLGLHVCFGYEYTSYCSWWEVGDQEKNQEPFVWCPEKSYSSGAMRDCWLQWEIHDGGFRAEVYAPVWWFDC